MLRKILLKLANHRNDLVVLARDCEHNFVIGIILGGEGGEILLVAKVSSSDGLTFRGANNGMYVFRLHRDGFKTGPFKYKFVVESAKGGSFQVQPYLIPMLAPQPGQEFAINPNATAQ